MKNIFLILVIIISSNHRVFTQDFYSTESVNKIEIFFEEENWDTILDEYWSEGNKKRLICRALINGTEFNNVGVRYKGFSSYKKYFLKKPLNIKLDFIEDQSYEGIKTIKLSNGFRDPTFIREVLAYEIFRKYMPASKANYAVVSINGIEKGLYTSVENVDKTFLKNHYRYDSGVLLKGAPKRVRGAVVGEANLKYLGNDSSTYFSSYDLKSGFGWKDLIKLCDVLNNNIEEIENYFNIDQALWLIALNNVLVNLDSPINVFRNFYLYKDATSRFNILPWDLNMAFGTYKSIAGSVSINTLQNLNPLFNGDNSSFPLISKLLQVPEYRKNYIVHTKTILKENFENGWYLSRANELQETIASQVLNDKNKFYTNEDFWINLESTIGNDVVFTVGIADLMKGRMDFLNSHNLFQFNQPSIIDINISPERVYPNSDVNVSCSVANAENVIFAYRTSLSDSFTKIRVSQLNRQENDGTQIYELPFSVGAGELQYFIYAENEHTAIFSPEQSEFRYYTLPISGDLVINEILSSNKLSIADEEGEYDDYIELFNNSNHSISLNNYYLSDKLDNPTKWKFPQVIIKPNGFLIIWADDDTEQGELHSNFKLSTNGEDLFLLNSEKVIIDKVSFGSQITDISYGRLPNGTGKFQNMNPSFAEYNKTQLEILDISSNNKFILYQNFPNPFNSNTVINYSISRGGKAKLSIYNLLGQCVMVLVDQFQAEGSYQSNFYGSRLSSGIYFYQFNIWDQFGTKKMLLIK